MLPLEIEMFKDRAMRLGGYYDIDTNPITIHEWGALFEDRDYRRIGETIIGPYRISTVWLGMDHSIFGIQPTIFETMIFGDAIEIPDDELGGYQERYTYKHQAIAGHALAVNLVKSKMLDIEC